jgi:IS30 family transposase
MQKYTQLTYEQRYHIYLLNKQVYNQTFIDKSMGRNKSTISCESKEQQNKICLNKGGLSTPEKPKRSKISNNLC